MKGDLESKGLKVAESRVAQALQRVESNTLQRQMQ